MSNAVKIPPLPGPTHAGLAPIPEYNELEFEDFSRHRPYRFVLAADCDELNRRIARDAVDQIKAANSANRPLLMILPVGPLDYRYWAALCAAEDVSCEGLTTMCMDEYLDGAGDYISSAHPLSFRGFIQRNFIESLPLRLRPNPANVRFPDPRQPGLTTTVIESFGGADVCYGGMGITGHFAFNDPPEPGEAVVDAEVRATRTRCLAITRESATQMAMGGVNGNWDILPRRAVTLGMYELLMSRRIHLTFMRSWHAGVLRRALFGPVTGRFPGSLLQTHSNVEVTLTRLAANVPGCNVRQATGETAET
jgi:glucosamine-6-phosphate deaminase